ncbi:putative E3 ubiquitin-protein ligase LUL4 [Vitis vinifera]|uniref:RING-type E3 ubiquitin transferase n=1 Tax=Vitis vinifera TaxID=29760 RepID=A0A438KL41_VITVI|nr:putative E3 ubiquitin-protein ligase LUL4 [Vitis vinifera]
MIGSGVGWGLSPHIEGFKPSLEEDSVLWRKGRSGQFRVKEAYSLLTKSDDIGFPSRSIWVARVPTKVAFFAWEASWGKVLTLDRLQEEDFNFQIVVSCVDVKKKVITIYYFAKEESNCRFSPLFPEAYMPVRIPFQKGPGQKFRQPSGTVVILRHVHPLHADYSSCPREAQWGPFPSESNQTDIVVNEVRYELREIYGIASSASEGFNDNDSGKECVICMTEPKDTAVLPCRHMDKELYG